MYIDEFPTKEKMYFVDTDKFFRREVKLGPRRLQPPRTHDVVSCDCAKADADRRSRLSK
jgi:hypothetical protein